MRVAIERMRLSDLPDVIRMERQCFPTPWRPETFRYEVCNNPDAYYIVARPVLPEGAPAIGYAGMWVRLDEAHITTIGVDPACRGMKVGERLLVNLLRTAIARGATRATLEVRESNFVAQRLYVKYGFDAVGMRRGYYSDTGENAILMWVEDLQAPAFQAILEENARRLEEQLARSRH